MSSAEERGQSGRRRWLGVGVRLLVTLFFLVLVLILSRCGPPLQFGTATPTPVEATARIRVEIDPPGAEVFVDGLRSGSTPVSLTLSPGQHTIRIEQDGYEPVVEMVNLAADSDIVLTKELAPLPASSNQTVTAMPSEMPQAKQPLPDLVVKQVKIELVSGGSCDYDSTQLGVRIWMENVGDMDAGPFDVLVNGVQQAVPAGLAAGETMDLWFTGYIQNGENVVVVDAASQIRESDEENNRWSQRLPIPTLPPICTLPPAASLTSRPADPSPTSTRPRPTESPETLSLASAAVTMREESITIPTYPYADFVTMARNEGFNMLYPALDRAAYEASNPTPVDASYRSFVVENEYLKLSFLPELGGRLYEVVYKPTGHTETYRNPVLKPSPWGPPEQGWWLAAGGIEWGFPVEEHGYEWGVPWKLSASHDGNSVTVTLRDSSAADRVQAEIAVRLEAGTAYFTIRPRLENPTSAPLQVKYWTNAMLAPGGQNAPSADLRFVLPEAVTQVTVHSRGDDSLPNYNERMPWPVVGGIDLSLLGNWNRWLGFFEDPAVGDFVAVYDEGYDEGMVRVFSAEVAQGAKGFGFGWHDPILPGNWTDDGSSYVELHGGPAPTFDGSVSIPATSHLQWTETWYPIAGMGGLRYANRVAALNLTAGGGEAQVAVAVPSFWSGDLVVLLNDQERWRQSISLTPGEPYRSQVALGVDIPQTGPLTLRLEAPDGLVVAEYTTETDLKR